MNRLLTVDTRLGRRFTAHGAGSGTPLVRVRPQDLTDAGIQRAPRLIGVTGGRPRLDDGRVLEVDNVVWCTGFARDYHWIRLPVLGPSDDPVHHRGVVDTEPGLYFVGLPSGTRLPPPWLAGSALTRGTWWSRSRRGRSPPRRLGCERSHQSSPPSNGGG